ncbi:MAG: preprotein translocase subunit SecY [Holosporales bacterium]|jgi:preprotein translocase subunit SecY|nr:preprotein translocase subunit SecY [Holosporales bacterium]
MASGKEGASPFARGFDFSTFSQATDLKKRILFTLAALFIYRLGTFVPLPGLNPDIIAEVGRRNMGGLLGMFDMFSGGALGRMTIFALGLMPYISASIIIQLFTVIAPTLEALKKEGESGRRRLSQYTRYLTVFIAFIHSYGICVTLMSASATAGAIVIGKLFFVVAIPSLIGGTLFLMWVGEQVTSRGIGNGASLIIFAGIVANLPRAVMNALEMGKTGALSPTMLFLIGVVIVAAIAFVVFIERAQRRIPIHYPQRQSSIGKGNMQDSTHLPLKLNSSGVIPPIFASSLLLLPATIISFVGGEWGQVISPYLSPTHPVYNIIYVTLLVFFAFFYTAIIFNPSETAENLRKAGGFIPGVRPGQHTAQYLDSILTRLTVIGSAYLVVICLLPQVLIAKMSVPFYFGGTNILIIVSVTIETVSQVYTHLLAHQYQGVLRKARNKGRIK